MNTPQGLILKKPNLLILPILKTIYGVKMHRLH